MGDRLGTTDMGRNDMGAEKWGLLCPFLWEGSWVPIQHNVAWAVAYLRTKWHPDPSNCLAAMHQRYRQGRQNNGPVA